MRETWRPGQPPAALLNGAAWTLGGWVTDGALEQADVEDGLYAAAERNGLVVLPMARGKSGPRFGVVSAPACRSRST